MLQLIMNHLLPTEERIVADYEDSGIDCPSCQQTTLEIITVGDQQDNITTHLRCNNCQYEEEE